MIQHIDAIYDHGVLKPLGILDLQDQEVVSLSIEKLSHSAIERDRAEPTLFDLLSEAGLVGCVKDAPADLSTNPEYMEGFGKSET